MHDHTERFKNRVENYVRYRPTYPQGLITTLQARIGLTSEWVVADIGSGTGISSLPFLRNGNRVYAVEPNEARRQYAEKSLGDWKNFRSVDAPAEATTLGDASVDLAVAGQALHWFDRSAAKREFQRILRPGRTCAFFWNDRDLRSALLRDWELMLMDLAPNCSRVTQRQVV